MKLLDLNYLVFTVSFVSALHGGNYLMATWVVIAAGWFTNWRLLQ